MCILCDLKNSDDTRENAVNHVTRIIEACDEVSQRYKSILRGDIKPHSSDMEKVINSERRLVKLLIDDVL